jgi:hypothetical protein
MKRLLLAALLAMTVSSSVGCCGLDGIFCRPGGCRGRSQCGPRREGYANADACPQCGLASRLCSCRRNANAAAYADPGPPGASITYPYYTTRGPRDFFAKSPRGIGP